MKPLDAIRLYITVSRWEFLPAVFIGIFIGVLLGADTIFTIVSPAFLPLLAEGLIIFILLFNVGFMVNCWADWKVDALYKTKLYQAVMRLGRRPLGLLVVVHIALAFLLALHLSVVLDRIEISLLVWVGTFLGVAYSVEPLRFKRRGVLHSLVAFPIFFIPGVYSFFLVTTLSLTDLYSLFFLVLAAGITIGHYALILVSQAEDLPADRDMNLITPAVRWGLHRTIRYSLAFNVVGSAFVVLSLTGLFLLVNVWLVVLIPLVVLSRFLSLKEVKALAKRSYRVPSESAYLEELRAKMGTYPLWHAYGLLGITVSCLGLVVVKTLSLWSPL